MDKKLGRLLRPAGGLFYIGMLAVFSVAAFQVSYPSVRLPQNGPNAHTILILSIITEKPISCN